MYVCMCVCTNNSTNNYTQVFKETKVTPSANIYPNVDTTGSVTRLVLTTYMKISD